jgi:hypothetical protein
MCPERMRTLAFHEPKKYGYVLGLRTTRAPSLRSSSTENLLPVISQPDALRTCGLTLMKWYLLTKLSLEFSRFVRFSTTFCSGCGALKYDFVLNHDGKEYRFALWKITDKSKKGKSKVIAETDYKKLGRYM